MGYTVCYHKENVVDLRSLVHSPYTLLKSYKQLIVLCSARILTTPSEHGCAHTENLLLCKWRIVASS